MSFKITIGNKTKYFLSFVAGVVITALIIKNAEPLSDETIKMIEDITNK
jgi:hypothetical protein